MRRAVELPRAQRLHRVHTREQPAAGQHPALGLAGGAAAPPDDGFGAWRKARADALAALQARLARPGRRQPLRSPVRA
jgi:hypothetical protein